MTVDLPPDARGQGAPVPSSPDPRDGSSLDVAAAPAPAEPLGLWEGVGVEIELMIVDARTLDVRPLADALLAAAAGREGASDAERGPIAWSNELALHVLELKTNGPAPGPEGLAARFQESVREADQHLSRLGARLLPGGVHPWMDPRREFHVWPHEYTEVYRTFDRVFGCAGHGWANLQSTHVNLPFRGAEEFFRLHEAVRLVLPLLPALAASSPLLDGGSGPALDNRLLAYRENARRIPSVTGEVIPERVRTPEAYRRDVLERIYRDLAPVDPEGILRYEWVNARGAIPRFHRGSVEIRLLDAQECPAADLAVVAAVLGAVRHVAEGPLREGGEQVGADVTTGALARLLERTIRDGERAPIDLPVYRALLGMEGRAVPTAGEAWRHLVEVGVARTRGAGEWKEPLRTILEEGPLARRILDALPGAARTDRRRIRAVYRRLADCLTEGRSFHAVG